MTTRRLSIVMWSLTVIGSAAIGVGVVVLTGCGSPSREPVIVPNPVSADCLLDRDRAQSDCVSRDAGFSDRQACLEHVRATRECVDGGS